MPQYICPTCSRQLISRIGPNCVFCGTAIPTGLLFTAEERLESDARKKALQQEKASDAERKARADSFDQFMNDGTDFRNDVLR